jgi:hypothetical protein
MSSFRIASVALASVGLAGAACGGSGGGDHGGRTIADLYGVGASCATSADCLQPEDQSFEQECLTAFTGGYCGLMDCGSNADCPHGSACARYEGATYCFRQCVDKAECNANRPASVQSNCSSNIDFVESGTRGKLCVPPSSGT